jgi:D-glycero-alpha-D-manno-heptose-7-phosphate kinase
MIIIKTPLRISLFGGGTDFPNYFWYNSGLVVTTAINKYVYVIIKQRFDDRIRLGYSQTENVCNVNDLQHELAREAIKNFGIDGIEISTMADAPKGTGLGSSSSVTVGLLHALYAYSKKLPTKENLASEAIAIEVNKLKKPIGYQDQIIAAYGGFKKIEFSLIDNFQVSDIKISQETLENLDKNLLLWYTDTDRDSSTILEEQNGNTNKNEDFLNQIKDIAFEANGHLECGNLHEIGFLLDKSWKLKRQLASKISSKKIDDLYEYALDNGALGGKICGAGGGGFLLTYCPLETQRVLKSAMKKANVKELPFSFEPNGSRVIFDGS